MARDERRVDTSDGSVSVAGGQRRWTRAHPAARTSLSRSSNRRAHVLEGNFRPGADCMHAAMLHHSIAAVVLHPSTASTIE
jgi:hypothetical protein